MASDMRYYVIYSSSLAYLTHSTSSSAITMFIFLLLPTLTPCLCLGAIYLLLAKSLVVSDLVIESLFNN